MIYLDNAATTMRKPDCVVEAVKEALGTVGNSGRGVNGASLGAARIVYETRKAAADFFGAESPSCIAFTMNATESLNIALFGTLQSGDHVITTEMEHNSVLRPLYMLEQQGVEVTILPCDGLGRIQPELFEENLQSNTKVIVCTHGSNLTGNLNDIQAIGEISERHKICFIVDASQTAGIYPIDVQKNHIDILCFTGHKSLLGPQGTGGLYVKPGRKVRPLIVGGSGIKTFQKTHPEEMPTALEAGTLNTHGLAGLQAGIRYIQDTGIEEIRQRELKLMWMFYHGVKEIEGVKIYGDFTVNERCPIVSLNLSDYDSGKIGDVLSEEYGIAVRSGGHCAPLMHRALGTEEQGAVRFSFSHGNTEEEVEKAINAIREIME